MSVARTVGLGMMVPAERTGQVARAQWAEANGYESLWLTDGGGRMDAFTLAAALAVKTERVRICLSVVPVYTRPPAVLATSAMTLSHLAPGRIVLGLGSSSHAMVEGWYGTPFKKPWTRVKESAQLVRRMLALEKIDYVGETLYSRGFRLGIAPAAPIPIYLAALRPRMLELAGEIADGVVLNLVPPAVVPRVLEHIDAGAKRAGRRVDDLEVGLLLNTFVTADPAAALEQFRGIALGYYATPVYNRFLAWCGYEQAATDISEGFAQRDRARTAAALDEAVLRELAALGSAEECRAMVRRYHEAGITTPIIVAASTDHGAYLETVRTFAPQPAA